MNPNDVERCKKVVREHFAASGMYKQFDLDHPQIYRNSATFFVTDASDMILTDLFDLRESFRREFVERFFSFTTCTVQEFYGWARKYFTITVRPE